MLGQKLKNAKRVKEAAAVFHTAWLLDPNNLLSLKQEGFCLYQLAAFPEAIEALSRYSE